MTARVEYFEDAEGGHRFRVLAGNHEILVTSEGYRDKTDAKRGFEALKRSIAETVWSAEWPDGIQEFKPLPYERPTGHTMEEWRANVQQTELWRRGDTCLIWVNEGDLFPHPVLMPPRGRLRVESGPARFGDDWAGLFLRGDHCFAYALALRAQIAQKDDAFSRAGVDGLIQALESTNEQLKRTDTG